MNLEVPLWDFPGPPDKGDVRACLLGNHSLVFLDTLGLGLSLSYSAGLSLLFWIRETPSDGREAEPKQGNKPSSPGSM